MSRINYAFATDDKAAQAGNSIRARMTLKEKVRDRSYMRMTMETGGLFLFGFGSAALLAQIAADLLESGAVSLPFL